MASYEILIADDHPLFRSALHQALTLGLGPDVRLVEAASIAELEARLNEKADWDLVLLDLNMPGAYGFSGLVLLRGQYPQVPVVMISAQEEAAVVQRSREFGASGFIPKSSPLETLQQAVRAVLDGDTWWPPQDAAAEALSEEAKAASAGLASLTPQQFSTHHGLRRVAEQADRLRPERFRGDGEGPRHGDLPQAQRAHPDPGRAAAATNGDGSRFSLRDGLTLF